MDFPKTNSEALAEFIHHARNPISNMVSFAQILEIACGGNFNYSRAIKTISRDVYFLLHLHKEAGDAFSGEDKCENDGKTHQSMALPGQSVPHDAAIRYVMFYMAVASRNLRDSLTEAASIAKTDGGSDNSIEIMKFIVGLTNQLNKYCREADCLSKNFSE